jgi:hypothetical protein
MYYLFTFFFVLTSFFSNILFLGLTGFHTTSLKSACAFAITSGCLISYVIAHAIVVDDVSVLALNIS